jgi:DNA-binding NarL/FixJ family response regulator
MTKIMIVDDHADMRRMLRNIVSLGSTDVNEIIECADGDDAVEQYSHWHPDFVLMDIQLKDMNGFETTEKIYLQDPKAKIIFVSSHDTHAYRVKAKTLHAQAFISKENLSELGNYIQSSITGESQ